VCKWDGASRCFGQTHPYFITPGGLHEGWDVAEREPVGRRVMGIFSWTPLRGMEGQRHRVCFRGGDAAGSAQLPEVCTYIGVAKCKCVACRPGGLPPCANPCSDTAPSLRLEVVERRAAGAVALTGMVGAGRQVLRTRRRNA